MSESTTAFIEAIAAFLISTCHRPSVLATALREQSGAIFTQPVVMEQIQAKGLEATQATRLLSFNRALQTPQLNALGSETMKGLTPSTVATLRALEATVTTGQLAPPMTQRQITSALSEMKTAVQRAHQTLALTEQKTVTNDLRSVLAARGYTVRLAESEAGRMKLIRAKKGEHVVAARIADTGTLELDLAGFEAGQCSQEREAIVHELEQRGYQIRIGQSVVHNRREGGEIVKTIEKEFQGIDDRLRRLNLAKAQQSRRLRR